MLSEKKKINNSAPEESTSLNIYHLGIMYGALPPDSELGHWDYTYNLMRLFVHHLCDASNHNMNNVVIILCMKISTHEAKGYVIEKLLTY